MAKQGSGIKLTGTIGKYCFYIFRGGYYVRAKSTLSGKRVRKSPAFRKTMMYAGWLAKASKLASGVYKAIPREHRGIVLYRTITGEGMRLLKAGNTEEEVRDALRKTFVGVSPDELFKKVEPVVERYVEKVKSRMTGEPGLSVYRYLRSRSDSEIYAYRKMKKLVKTESVGKNSWSE